MDWQAQLALRIAEKSHEGQFDRAGEPYINHPLAVAGMVGSDGAKAVAYLHDVLEDTDMTMGDLKGYGFENKILEAVDILTKRPTMTYDTYIDYLYNCGCALAIEVKIADLRHNMDLTRLKKVTKKDVQRQHKYLKALALLMGVDLNG